MVLFRYVAQPDDYYLSGPWTDKLTMSQGVENPNWCVIAELTDECATLAMELRAKLDDLHDVMREQESCTIKDEYGCYEGISEDEIEEYSRLAADIERNLSN